MQVCAAGFCGPAVPTASIYAPCALDAECSAGAYCSLGACGHDCLRDRDCSQGTVCTNRGRCVALDAVNKKPEVTAPQPARLEADPGPLDFGRSVDSKTITLRNTGGEPVAFRALTDKAWLDVEPSHGVVSGQPVKLEVTIHRDRLGGDTRALLRINSNAGQPRIDVIAANSLTGAYAGEVQITEPFEIARSNLVLHINERSDGTVFGHVAGEQSMLYGFNSPISGRVDGDNVALSFDVPGSLHSPLNPWMPRAIRRSVTLSGRLVAAGVMEGALTDEIVGIIDTAKVQVRGSFRLQYASPDSGEPPEALPRFELTATGTPLAGPEYDTCRTQCPESGQCGNPLAAGDAYLRASAAFYRFFNAYSSVGATNPFVVARNQCGGSSCLNALALRCAQYHYASALLHDPDNVAAASGLMDALEVLTDYALLVGTDQLVSASESWRTVGTVGDEVTKLTESLGTLEAGGHTATLARPQAFFDPYYLQLLWRVPAGVVASSASRIATPLLGDAPAEESRRSFEYLRRQLLRVSFGLKASLQLADRQHRLGLSSEAAESTTAGVVGAYLDLAVLSALASKAGATAQIKDDLQSVSIDFAALGGKWGSLVHGRNSAGYAPGFVPFFVEPARLPRNNYQQLFDYTTQTVYAGYAREEQDRAQAAGRGFEESSEGLANQLTNQRDVFQQQINSLCGTTDVDRCGSAGGQVFTALSQIRAACLRIQQGQQRLENLAEEVRIEQQTANQIAGIHNNEAQLILADGQKLNALAEEQRIVDENAQGFQLAGSLLNVLGSALSFNFTNAAGLLFNTAGAAVSTGGGTYHINESARIQKARTEVETKQRARVEFAAAQQELVRSAGVIHTKLLETATLNLELQIARENLVQAVGELNGLREQVDLLSQQRARLSSASAAIARRLLTFRLFSNAEGLKAEASFRLMMRWAYLTTRALEYELNLSYAGESALWMARSAYEVNAYLLGLDTFYQQNRMRMGLPQTNVEVISVRDHLLNLEDGRVDRVTWNVYTARERFKRYVADFTNRDVDGNLHLAFMTHRPDNPIFSRAVCNDRIKSIRINLIGDDLGAGASTAFVRLKQGGANHLRACDGDRGLVSYDVNGSGNSERVARIQAGINASNDGLALLPNTDLLYRALLAGPWELVIDQRPEVEPANAGLNVLGLDDIELVIEHESNTLQ